MMSVAQRADVPIRVGTSGRIGGGNWNASAFAGGALTGQVIIEWVDGSDPDDPTVPPNFGWSIKTNPPLDDERLALLLREISEVI